MRDQVFLNGSVLLMIAHGVPSFSLFALGPKFSETLFQHWPSALEDKLRKSMNNRQFLMQIFNLMHGMQQHLSSICNIHEQL